MGLTKRPAAAPSVGLTFDTGALIALGAKRERMVRVFKAAMARSAQITVPSAVVAEWWRNSRDAGAAELLRSCIVEPLREDIAKSAGLALAAVGGGKEDTIDAIVVASAALRGDVIYTSDPDDLKRFAESFFSGVRVRSVNDGDV